MYIIIFNIRVDKKQIYKYTLMMLILLLYKEFDSTNSY